MDVVKHFRQANGYVRGEGIGVLMVKKLKDAIKDGDNIYAVVKGTAENHGGHANSLTAPNPKSQAAVIKRALQDAEMDFSRVSYVECHGTGTPLGDPIEIEGLKMVASSSAASKEKQECKLGSIKSNIGHLEYGAGVVGLLKVILQMKHEKIAKTLHCDAVNPYIKLEGTPFKIAHQSSDWKQNVTQPRVAGVSSFGFGGVNAHIVLEEYLEPKTVTEEKTQETAQKMVFVVSANDPDGLKKYLSKYKEYIQKADQNTETLERIAYTLQTGRSEMPERVAFVADSFQDWEQQIDAYLNENDVKTSGKIFRNSVYKKKNKNTKKDESQREYIQKLIAENNHEKIAELWTEGAAIDWELLYQ